MGTKARTEHGDFLFAVKEFGGPTYEPWIVAEPRRTTTTLIGRGAFLGFTLHTKNRAEAEDIAKFLNDNIDQISFTIFDDHPMFSASPES
jgi:hypothetical protein